MKKLIWIGVSGLCAIALLVAATGPVFQGVRILRETNGEATTLLVRNGLRLLNATGGRATTYDANGVLTNGPVTSAELLFLSGVSSAIQGQLDAKISNATLAGATNDLSNALIVRMDSATNALAGVFETRVTLATNTAFSYTRTYANSATQALDTTLRAVITAATNSSGGNAYTDSATNALDGTLRTLITTATNNNATTSRTYADAATNALAGVLRTRMDAGTNDLNTVLRAYANSATQALAGVVAANILTTSNGLYGAGGGGYPLNNQQFNTNSSSAYIASGALTTNLSARGVLVPNATAGRAIIGDANSTLTNSVTTATELGYLSGISGTPATITQLNSASNAIVSGSSGNATTAHLNALSNAIVAFVTPSFTNIPGTVIDWFNPGHYKVISGNIQFSFINTNESPIGVEVVISAAGGPYGVTFPETKWLNGIPPTNIVTGVRHYHFWQITNVVHGEWVPYTTNGNPMLPLSYATASTNVVVDFNYPAPILTASSSIRFVHSTNKLHQVRLKTEFKILPYVSDRLMFFHNNWAPTFSITNVQITALHSTNGIRLASNTLFYASFVADAISEDAVGFYDFRGGAFIALPPQLLVDLVPDSIYGAWSIARKLKYSYAGSAIRIRASADDAETDIGFDGNGNLDTNAIVAFAAAHASSTACFVVRVYDQDGTGNNDLTQASNANQPWIYSNSVMRVASNGRPAAYSNGGRNLTNLNTSVSHPLSIYAVMQRTAWNANKVLLGGGVGPNVTVEQTGDSDQIRLYSGIYLTPVVSVTTNLVSLIFAKYNVPNSAMRFNNGSYSTGDSGSYDPDGVSFLDQSNGLQGSEAMFIEAVAYNDAHVNGGAPSITISDNINGYHIIW